MLNEVCRKVPVNPHAVYPGFTIMSMADVKLHFLQCAIGEWDVVALSDGKFIGYGYSFLEDERIIPGNYLGCTKGQMLIMTDSHHRTHQAA